MIRPRRGCALSVVPALVLLLGGQSRSAQEKKGSEKPAEKWLLDRALTVKPAAAPMPALRYRLFPSYPERKEGNAVPIYLRFAHERSDVWKKELREKPEKWNKLPLDKLPLAEVKKFLAGQAYNLRQLDLGARRKNADWSYTFDAGDPVGLRLPDAQEMRMQAPLLVLAARVAMAEGRYPEAIRTLGTGFSFSQQLSQAPLLINGLIGLACAEQLAGCLPDLLERPDSPNLYWALAVIPRPLIDFRNANEVEQNLLEMQFPDLANLDRLRSAEEWDAALKRIRTEIERIERKKMWQKPSDPAAKSPDLPIARKYLAEVSKLPAARLAKMSPAEVLIRHMSGSYRQLYDEVFKITYLPYPQARLLARDVGKRLQTPPDTEAAFLSHLFLPAILKVQSAQTRINRRLALLRAVEALRMHAAANGGKLPGKLSEVTVVPVPNDPGTGLPFEYRVMGQTATLTGRIPGEVLQQTGLRYRVTMQK